MIRINVRTDDAGMAANVGGAVKVSYKSFDIEAPEVEAFLSEFEPPNKPDYTNRQVVGIEVLK